MSKRRLSMYEELSRRKSGCEERWRRGQKEKVIGDDVDDHDESSNPDTLLLFSTFTDRKKTRQLSLPPTAQTKNPQPHATLALFVLASPEKVQVNPLPPSGPELEHEDCHVVGRPRLDGRRDQRPRGLVRVAAGLGDRHRLLVGEAAAAAALDVDEEALGEECGVKGRERR